MRTAYGFSVDTTGPSGGGGKGIYLYSKGGISFTDTNQATITGFGAGIDAYNHGTGALEITATGAVTSINGIGIDAYVSYGTDLTISAADVTGGKTGIYANNYLGTGALMITATGAVTGTKETALMQRTSPPAPT